MVLNKGDLEAQLRDEHELIKSGVLRDENPLDLSEGFNQFLQACRMGDLKTCQELIQAGVNINGKDKFDYTPLIVVSILRPDLSCCFSLIKILGKPVRTLRAGRVASRVRYDDL
jgi:hypothetical protein